MGDEFEVTTAKLRTKNLPAKIASLKLSGKFPMDMRIPIPADQDYA